MEVRERVPSMPRRVQMTRARIAEQLALEQGLSRAAALQIVNAMLQIISDRIAGGEEVCLPPVGRLKLTRSSGSSCSGRRRVKFSPAPSLARKLSHNPGGS
jgi:hypothetical protein